MAARAAAQRVPVQTRFAERPLVVIAGVAAVYAIAARLALWMAIPPGYATAVWPAAGLGLICVLSFGRRAAAGVVLGSFAVNLTTALDTTTALTIARSLAIAGAIATGAALQCSLGAALIRRRVGFPSGLHDERDIAWFFLLGGPLACLASSTISVTALSLAGAIAWSGFAFHAWTWWVGDTIGVLVFAPLALLVVPGPHPVWRRRRAIIGAPLVLGFAAVTLLFVRVSGSERTRLRTDFDRRSATVEAVLRSQVSDYEEVVASLTSLFDASSEVTRSEFHTFCARPLAKYPAIAGLSWDPWVPAAQRAGFEQRARDDGLAGFAITEIDAAGELRLAGPRPSYVPVLYTEPVAANRAAFGFNVGSNPSRRDAFDRAARSRQLAATRRIDLVQDGELSPAGVLLVAPVFAPVTGALRGYAVGVFRLNDLVDSALGKTDHDGMSIHLVDLAADGRELYTSNAAARSAVFDERRTTLPFADRRWQLAIAPTAAFVATQRSWQAWTVLAGGLLFVAMLGAVLLITTGRTFRLHEGAERFRALVDASAQIVWTSNADGEVVEDSPSWRAFTGQSVEQWLGWGRADAIHPDDRIAFRERWREVIAARAVVESEYRIRHVTGEWRWMTGRAVPLIDEQGGLRGWVMSNTDVTERKRAADQFRIAIDAAPTGMVMVDAAGRIALVNAQTEKLFGYTRDELIGAPIEMLIPTRFAAHAEHRAGDRSAPDTRPIGGDRDLHGLRKDGREVPVEIGHHPLRAADQDYVLASIVDITERKAAETQREALLAELRALNAELEQRVQARTSELTASLREREVLLQEVHHRVKNNLQVISSLINMQVRKLVGDADRGALEECQTRVQAIALIHEQLYQSRDYANVPFSDYTRTLVNNVFRTMEVSPDSIKLDLAIDNVAVPVDKAIPCGLLLNELITNALKHAFTEGRSGELRVELARTDHRVRLVVKDNGVGLPIGLDIGSTRSLGLRLVNMLTRQLRGTLDVASRDGARFELSFAVEN